MKIIIVGCGKVGYTVGQQLAAENHELVMIDVNSEKLHRATDSLDAMGIVGNGVNHMTLQQAGIETADLLIAVTGNDERNLLCCVVAKKAGHCQTIARIRNPIYNEEVDFLKREFGISMIINQELAAAGEMFRIFQFPSAIRVDSFAKGNVELLHFKVQEGSPLVGLKMYQLHQHFHSDVLVCTVMKNQDEVIIPNGSYEFEVGDTLGVVAQKIEAVNFFKKISMAQNRVQNVLIAGGGEMAFYLARLLIRAGTHVTIIDMDKERCEILSTNLPSATIICGDATDQELLAEEGIENIQGFAALTGLDEENILMSLYAQEVSKAKTITRVDRSSFNNIINNMNLGSIIYPRVITSDYILRLVRASVTDKDSEVETLYKLAGGKAEALEFIIKSDSDFVDIPLQELNFKSNTLIGCIYRDGKVIIPKGQDCLKPGDSVMVVLSGYRVSGIGEIFDK